MIKPTTVSAQMSDRIKATAATVAERLMEQAEELSQQGASTDVLDPRYPSITRADGVAALRAQAAAARRRSQRVYTGRRLVTA